jgi:CHASE3 domain sensor protein
MVGDETATPRLSLRQLIWICLGAISVVFIASTAFSVLGRVNVARAMDQLSQHMLPAQEQVAALSKAYVDQETGQRGFMLTADQNFLEPYFAGRTAADRLVPELRASLAGHAEAGQRINDVVVAAQEWSTQAAEPQIAARRAGPIPPDQLEAIELMGKRLFDQLRTRLSALEVKTGELIGRQLDRVHAAQRLANIAEGTAALLLVAVASISVWLFHRVLTRPGDRVLRDVTAVAEGDYDRAIRSAGLREIALLADAAETMRDSLRTGTMRLLGAERRDEQARIAANLHDRIIQRMFALGLGLTSAAQRSPDLTPFVDETNRILADLREVVFNLNLAAATPADDAVGLGKAVSDVVEDSVSALGFTPDLELEGPIDESTTLRAVRIETLAVLCESLSNIASHAQATALTIHLAATDDQLRLTLRDNGIGITAVDPSGDLHRNIHRRAQQFGGYATMRNAANGETIVEWAVPLASAKVADRSD